MKISLRTVGGLAPFVRPATQLDTSALDDNEQRQVQALVEAARFFDLPDELPADPAARDVQGTLLQIDTGERSHTVGFDFPNAPAALRELVTQVRKLVAQQK